MIKYVISHNRKWKENSPQAWWNRRLSNISKAPGSWHLSSFLSLSDVYMLRLMAGKLQQCQVTHVDSDFQRQTETVFPLWFPLGGKDKIPNAQ